MSIVAAFVLGVIQGMSEFFPISSSGHLILARLFLPAETINSLVFDVMLHLGTLLAVIVAMWADVVKLFWGLIDWFRRRANPMTTTVGRIVIACLPAAVVGVLFDKTIETTVRSPFVVVVALALVALVFLLVERRSTGSRDLTQLSWREALLIGSFQAIALIPGVSRSGITIVGGLLLGMRHQSAARFSFLISIPVIFGAALTQGVSLAHATLAPGEMTDLIVGIVASALAGFFSIRFLLKFLAKGTLRPFAYYRLALAAVIIVCLWFGVGR